jgi:hypothetical protein
MCFSGTRAACLYICICGRGLQLSLVPVGHRSGIVLDPPHITMVGAMP